MRKLYSIFLFLSLFLAFLGFLYLSLGHLPQQEYLMRMSFEEKAQQILQEYKKEYETVLLQQAQYFLEQQQVGNIQAFENVEQYEWVLSSFWVNNKRIVYPKTTPLLAEENEEVLTHDMNGLYQKGYEQEILYKNYETAKYFYELALSQIPFSIWQIKIKLRIATCLDKMQKQNEAKLLLQNIVNEYKDNISSYWYLVAHYRYALLCKKESQEAILLQILQQLIEQKISLPRFAQYEYWIKILTNLLPDSEKKLKLLATWQKKLLGETIHSTILSIDWSFVKNTEGIHWYFDTQNNWLFACVYKNENIYGIIFSPQKIQLLIPKEQNVSGYQVKIGWQLDNTNTVVASSFICTSKIKMIALPQEDNQLQQMIYHKKMFVIILTIIVFFILVISLATSFYNYRKAVKYSQIQSEFVACISHELRTPLALIHSFAETLLLKRISPDKYERYHTVILRESQRLSKLIENVLNVSQIESKNISLSIEQVNIRHIVDLCIENRSWYWGNYTGKIINNIADKTYLVDESAIVTIVFNLIDNAVKYTQNNKDIVIGSCENENEWSISVKDQGIGISKEEQAKIFSKFYQIDKRSKGVGLGLLIVDLFCAAHGGKVTIQSEVGRGSTFTVVFSKRI